MKDDKKKLVVLGVLLVVMLAVGAFTFMGGGSSTPTAAVDSSGSGEVVKVNADGSTGDHHTGSSVTGATEEELPKNPLYAADLPQRDPFVSAVPGATDRSYAAPQPTTARPVRRPTQSNGNGSIPPFQPMPGTLTGNVGGVSISPSGSDPNQFGYTVSGVITGGGKPAAVFTDASGNQRLVPVGGSLDGDSKVVAIDKGNVIIEHRGKTQRLSLGGNPK